MSAPDSARESAPNIAPNTVTGGAASSNHGAPGTTLREARERAGLSQDDIASKLKLAPRQIAAIEAGDWNSLPERTFTRGFMRNYARIVGVDPAVVGLDRSPSQPNMGGELKPTPEAIGEIAMHVERSRSHPTRWAVPLLLIAVLAAGVVYYQWGAWFGLSGKSATSSSATDATKPGFSRPVMPADGAALTPPTASSSGSVMTAPAANADVVASAAETAQTLAVDAAKPANLLAGIAGDKRITLTFRGKSWTEVRSKGDVIYSEASLPGTREFSGSLPLSFIVGNADNVSVSVDGKPYDMSPFTRNDVARFRVE